MSHPKTLVPMCKSYHITTQIYVATLQQTQKNTDQILSDRRRNSFIYI
jgi:hypothetical protein